MAGLALAAGAAAGNIHLPLGQIVQHGLAANAVFAQVQHLAHRIVGAVDGDARNGRKALAQAAVQRGQMLGALGKARLHLLRGSGKAHGIGNVFGAGAHALFLPAAQKGQLHALTVALAQKQCAHALGGMDLVPAHRKAVDVIQPERHAHPALHGIDMHRRARVGGFHQLGQLFRIHTGAQLVVHQHTGHQNGALVHIARHFFHIQMAVLFRGNLDHLKALLGQTAQRQLHAGMLEPAHHNAPAPVLPGVRRAQQRNVVAFRAAARKIHLGGRAAQGFGHRGAAAVEQLGVFQPGGVQAAGIGPVFGQAFAHRSHNLRRGNGGGGIIQIVQIFVCQHKRNSFLRDDFPSRRVFR